MSRRKDRREPDRAADDAVPREEEAPASDAPESATATPGAEGAAFTRDAPSVEAPRPDDAEPAAAQEADAPPATPPRIERRKSPLRRKVIGVVIVVGFAIAAFGTGMFVFNYLLMPGLIHSGTEVRVPDLRNLSLEQAESVAAQEGLQLSRAGERFDSEVPRGFVISQDPQPGSPVRRQKTVQVVSSLGEEFSSVPALFGESRRSAEQLLQSSGLAVGRITRAPSGAAGEGLVLGTDPPAESVLPRGTPVSLLVSTGPGARSYLMPDLLGREISRARAQLEAFGLYVRVLPSNASIGAIMTQNPRPGAQISVRDTVTLQAAGRLIQ